MKDFSFLLVFSKKFSFLLRGSLVVFSLGSFFIFFYLLSHYLEKKNHCIQQNILHQKELLERHKILSSHGPSHLFSVHPWIKKNNSQHFPSSQKNISWTHRKDNGLTSFDEKKNTQYYKKLSSHNSSSSLAPLEKEGKDDDENINNNNNNEKKSFYSLKKKENTADSFYRHPPLFFLDHSFLWKNFPKVSLKFLHSLPSYGPQYQKKYWESWIRKALYHSFMKETFLRVTVHRAILTKNLSFQWVNFSLGFLTKNDDNFWLFFYSLLHQFPGIILPKVIKLNPSVSSNRLTLRGSFTFQCCLISCLSS